MKNLAPTILAVILLCILAGEIGYASYVPPFPDGALQLLGSSSGKSTIKAPSTGGGTATLQAGSGTIAYVGGSGVGTVTSITCGTGLSGGTITSTGTCTLNLSNANTWAAVQTFGNGDLSLAGSSSGHTLLEAAVAASGTISFPAVNDTVAVLGTPDQTQSGGVHITPANLGTVSSGTTTIDCGTVPMQYLINGGAFTLAAPSNDGSCTVLTINNSSAGTISFSGFSVGSSTGDAMDTTNTHQFSIFIWRIDGTSGYRVAAHQ
jgi:hypothetical protein